MVNTEQRHTGIALYTPAGVHHGRTGELAQVRAGILAGAYAARPERFVQELPLRSKSHVEVWINPPAVEVLRARSPDDGASRG